MPPGLAWYFCCITPGERSVFRATAEALLLTLFVGVPLDVWDAFWLGVPQSPPIFRSAFLATYQLEIVTIVDPETELDVEVVRPTNLPYWVEASLFVFTSEAACSSGCEQSTVLPP